MKIAMFYHSLVSDWNHGNAHFLRGVVSELMCRGHEVTVYEPRDCWSLQNLLAEHGTEPLQSFQRAYSHLASVSYARQKPDLETMLEGADLVIVHEWNDHQLVARIGEHRKLTGGYVLLFHDTHHRMVTDSSGMNGYDLSNYDGVLAYGRVLQALYQKSGRVRQAWTWHEAADVRIFRPNPGAETCGDLVWIGNWGDDERSAELHEFLIAPADDLRLRTRVYGVRYPEDARRALADAGIEYCGWLPNFQVPRVFAGHLFTVHVPRRPYVRALPGIPTIRPFEALACGIPLVCSPWEDVEGLFTPGRDYLVARNGAEMREHLRALKHDESLRRELAEHGLRTVAERHTCAHRVDQLLSIVAALQPEEGAIPQTTYARSSLPAVI